MVPKHVFLDTNVFAGQSYNFDSSAFTTFTAAAQAHTIELLLPDPIEKEVSRHIRERSEKAVKALNDARREAPFLKKWAHFPKDSLGEVVDYEITRVAGNEWHRFKKQFTVKQLGYEGVSIAQVMGWYDRAVPPFGTGAKRKEFPDAFAVAILDKYADDNNALIAVVSDDQDMKTACKSRPRFLSFASLPRLTELLVTNSAEVESLREAILRSLDLVHDAVLEQAADLGWYHESSDFEIVESDLTAADFDDVRVVALGQKEATIAFEGLISAEHDMRWKVEDFDGEWITRRARIIDSGVIHGMAKVELNPQTREISSVQSVTIDEGELPVTESPPHW
ncbi:PIN domain-containing protein [Variovorax sp. RB3P1]|uniref:PIN domain-containing protein n=1 Tax=Variovorax sp. RB3P1 TaxID=3443732 RepID=UPI003F44F6B5